MDEELKFSGNGEWFFLYLCWRVSGWTVKKVSAVIGKVHPINVS
jgi:hypothetical protein